jgi:histidinol dehydrogenase
VQVRRLSTADAGFEKALADLLAFETAQDPAVDSATAAILDAVRARGDAALVEFTARFDRWTPGSAGELEIPMGDARAALETLPQAEHNALTFAASRIRAYHERQRQDSWRFEEPDGTVLGQQVMPLDRVGLYVPGGKAAYPSSVLMSAVAAKVAGVAELVMVTPAPAGAVNASVLAAGGACGRRSHLPDRRRTGDRRARLRARKACPAVDKIVGPGNAYVAAAKRRVFGRVGIDMVAGPSEVLGDRGFERARRLGGDGPLFPGRALTRSRRRSSSRRMRSSSSGWPSRCSARSPRCRARTSSPPR